MRIFIVTLGARGDVQPFIALGKGLQAVGHAVTLCTSCNFEPLITGHQLDYGFMNDGLIKLVHTVTGREAIEDMTYLWGVIKSSHRLWKHVAPLQKTILEDSWNSAQKADPDLIIFHPMAYGGPHFAEKLGIPAMMASPIPLYVPTAEFPSISFPTWNLGGWYNKLTYTLLQRLALFGGQSIKEWRKEHHLPPQPWRMDLLHSSNGEHIPVLHAYSRYVAPVPADWPDNVVATGYWFLEHPETWQPSQQLQSFLASGSPPIYVGFGSMARSNPLTLTRIVIEALQQAGVRGIIATGWGGLVVDALPETIINVVDVPHDWLFPHMAAVIHHGGAGTTAAGLRAGCPTIICPFFGDQFFWGERVLSLNVGSKPIPQKQLTVENLVSAIGEVMHSKSIWQHAQELGEKIRDEKGVDTAIAMIEKHA